MKVVRMDTPNYKYLYMFKTRNFKCIITRFPVVGQNKEALWFLKEDGDTDVVSISFKRTSAYYCLPDDGDNEIIASEVLDGVFWGNGTRFFASNSENPKFIQPEFLNELEEKLNEEAVEYYKRHKSKNEQIAELKRDIAEKEKELERLKQEIV